MGARLQSGELNRGVRVGCGRLKTGDAKAVGDDRSGTACRGQDRDTLAAELAPGGESGRNVEQVLERLRPDHAKLPEQGIVHAI